VTRHIAAKVPLASSDSLLVIRLRSLALATLLVACERAADAPPAPAQHRVAIVNRPMFELRQITPRDPEILEEWKRAVDGPRADVYGVDAWRSAGLNPRSVIGSWSVAVNAMEFVRDVPFERELRQRIATALRAVPGITDVVEGDREVWVVGGSPSGRDLATAVAAVVDELAPKIQAYLRDTSNDAL